MPGRDVGASGLQSALSWRWRRVHGGPALGRFPGTAARGLWCGVQIKAMPPSSSALSDLVTLLFQVRRGITLTSRISFHSLRKWELRLFVQGFSCFCCFFKIISFKYSLCQRGTSWDGIFCYPFVPCAEMEKKPMSHYLIQELTSDAVVCFTNERMWWPLSS